MQNDETECENEASYLQLKLLFYFFTLRIINQHQDTSDKQHV